MTENQLLQLLIKHHLIEVGYSGLIFLYGKLANPLDIPNDERLVHFNELNELEDLYLRYLFITKSVL